MLRHRLGIAKSMIRFFGEGEPTPDGMCEFIVRETEWRTAYGIERVLMDVRECVRMLDLDFEIGACMLPIRHGIEDLVKVYRMLHGPALIVFTLFAFARMTWGEIADVTEDDFDFDEGTFRGVMYGRRFADAVRAMQPFLPESLDVIRNPKSIMVDIRRAYLAAGLRNKSVENIRKNMPKGGKRIIA